MDDNCLIWTQVKCVQSRRVAQTFFWDFNFLLVLLEENLVQSCLVECRFCNLLLQSKETSTTYILNFHLLTCTILIRRIRW